MNLLDEYIPEYSGHVESIEFDAEAETLEIVFFDRPEEFTPVIKLLFQGVTEFHEEIEDLDEDCIELVVGLDLWHDGYCLRTDQREINFKASKVVSIEINT